MKKKLLVLLPFLPVACLTGCNNQPTNLKEWTVLSYICATDLETMSGAYTKSLSMITELEPSDKVNFLVQVGGTSAYSEMYEPAGIIKDPTKTYRYSYKTKGTFTKEYEGQATSMSEPDTLTSFIKWAKQNYPAKHYYLELCDHGGGAYYGFGLDSHFCDPRYADHFGIMSLDQIEEALTNGGIHFDIMNMAACEMSNIETMQALYKNVTYMLGSEEVTSTRGDSTSERAKYFFDNYYKTVEETAKGLCETVYTKEKNKGVGERAYTVLLDLAKTPQLTTNFNEFWKVLRNNISNFDAQKDVTKCLTQCDRMTSPENIDLGNFLDRISETSPAREAATKLTSSIDEAILLKKNGTSHPNCHGISFYYDNTMSSDMLDHFVRGERYNPEYLAYIDMTTNWWVAPSSIYEQVQKLDTSLSAANLISYTTNFDNFSTTGATITINSGLDATYKVEGMLYANCGGWYCIGKDTNITFDYSTGKGTAQQPKSWAYLINTDEGTDNYSIVTLDPTQDGIGFTSYNIPVLMPTKVGGSTTPKRADIICTLDNASLDFDIHGICTYINEYSRLPDGEFNPWPSGDDKGYMKPLYYGTDSSYRKTGLTYNNSLGMSLVYNSEVPIRLEYSSLKAGTYGYAFCVTDMFGHEVLKTELFTFKIK